MEYLYVGDYGKENNIKADFLGYKKEINQVSHHEVNLRDKNGDLCGRSDNLKGVMINYFPYDQFYDIFTLSMERV